MKAVDEDSLTGLHSKDPRDFSDEDEDEDRESISVLISVFNNID